MCYGAIIWSGVTSVVTNVGPEMEEITGFDEGPLHPMWREELRSRGIDLQAMFMWSEALKVSKSIGTQELLSTTREGINKGLAFEDF